MGKELSIERARTFHCCPALTLAFLGAASLIAGEEFSVNIRQVRLDILLDNLISLGVALIDLLYDSAA